jgi:hypothetical protein
MVALSTDRINFDDMREAAARDAVEKVAADLPRLSEALKESSEALGLYANKVSAGDVGADWGLITAATLTRVSTMLVLIFVTQILVGVHRYNSKLGVFLHTRADALELAAGIQREEFAILIERLAPTNLEFERVPKAPMDQVVALARELAGVMRKP